MGPDREWWVGTAFDPDLQPRTAISFDAELTDAGKLHLDALQRRQRADEAIDGELHAKVTREIRHAVESLEQIGYAALARRVLRLVDEHRSG